MSINNKKVLCTICARGGSKGVINKNIKILDGLPVICYSLNLIKKSKYIDDYVISTDSEEIIKIVKEYDFKVEFKRPKELAGDKISRLDVVKHAVKWKETHESTKFDIIVDLGVATPLKSHDDLDRCLEVLENKNCSNVISVTPSSRNPYYNMVERVDDKIKIVKTVSGHLTDRRDAPPVYDLNDGFNVWNYDILFSNQPQFNEKTEVYIMPPERSIDIDEEIDFIIAESYIKYNQTRNSQ